MSSTACLTSKLQIPGKRFFMGGTHPCIFTALDGPTVYFARKQLRFACYLHLLKESNSLLFAPGHVLSATEHPPMMANTQAGRRGSRISVAKAESLGKFLLVFIKVNQVHVIFGILVVNSEHHEMRRADDRYHAQHMPHTGL